MGNWSSVDFTPLPEEALEKRLFYDIVEKMKDHDFKVENIVFQGGGAKGYAYCGAVQVLEEIGIWKNVRRLAGTSAGSICAAILSVGYTSAELRGFLDQTQESTEIFLDHKWGYTTWPRNMFNIWNKFGWHNGHTFLDFLGQLFVHKGNKADMTFREVYEKYGKELCVVVTNVNRMDAEYCHVKTTPHMPVRVAVRMSMSIPFMFEAVPYDMWDPNKRESLNYYVDGGVLCNYPVHCYDGWYLSMKPADRFLNKLDDFENLSEVHSSEIRFGKRNENTLGFLVYADDEASLFKPMMDERDVEDGKVEEIVKLPETKMASKFRQRLDKNKKLERNVFIFLRGLKNANNAEHYVVLDDIQHLMNDDETKNAIHYLFDPVKTAEDVFKKLKGKNNNDNQLAFFDIARYLKGVGFDLRSHLLGYEPQETTGLFSFTKCLIEGMMTSGQRSLAKKDDVLRTVGINTRYITTVATDMEKDDRDYLINQGRRATVVFLQCKFSNKPITDLYPDYLEALLPVVSGIYKVIQSPEVVKPFLGALPLIINAFAGKPNRVPASEPREGLQESEDRGADVVDGFLPPESYPAEETSDRSRKSQAQEETVYLQPAPVNKRKKTNIKYV